MAKIGEYRARAGYERLPGKARQYLDTATGETLSRRQYIKRTEGIPSLENKASRLRGLRLLNNTKQPMQRYNTMVKRWREVRGPGSRVRGTSAEAVDFRSSYKKIASKNRRKVLEGLLDFHLISPEEFARYADTA